MKKTFRFFALSFALICGTVSAWADARPADGPIDGASVGSTVATTEGLQGVVTYVVNGWDATLNAYTVQIEGLDYDGLQTNPTTLTIQTSFVEKWKTVQYKYYVNKIIDTQGSNPADVDTYKKAFYAMTDLTSLKFQATESAVATDKFTFSVGDYAFYGCTSLKTLVFPDNVNRIGKYAFQGTIIEDFVIPAKCAEIGACAFNDTKKLKTVSVSETGNAVLTTIDKQVFANSYVSELDLSKATALESINDQAFIYNVSDVNAQLKSVTLPDVAPKDNKFVSLGANGTCFANCMALEEVNNLEKSNVTDINPGAFQNCVKLAELNFPATASILSDGTTSPFLNTPLLKKITFAADWGKTGQFINSDVYLSSDGKKIKYSTAEKKYVLEPYTLTAADLKKELGYLEEIEFQGAVYGTISRQAFGNYDEELACKGLTTVTFTGALKEGAFIGEYAFAGCEALATVTFGGGINASNKDFDGGSTYQASGDVIIADYAFAGTAIAAVDFNGITMGDASNAKEFYVGEKAFVSENLASVATGDIKVDGTQYSGVYFTDYTMFVSDKLTTFTIGNIDVTNSKGTVEFGYDDYDYPVAAPADKDNYPAGVLTTVTVGNITSGGNVNFNESAFMSDMLETVEIAKGGNITSSANHDGYVYFDELSFGGKTAAPGSTKIYAVNPKSVTIGNMTDNAKPTKLEVYVDNLAFYGDLLTNVEIGNLAANEIYFDPMSFSGKTLENIQIGNITGATVYIDGSFRNLAGPDAEAMDEVITIGKFASTGLTITPQSFLGPKADGSSFTVTIGEEKDGALVAGIEKDPSYIGAGAFVCPADVATTSYTIGDINATANINAGAFAGNVDADGKTNTSVKIGDYNKAFANGTFTNVNDVTTADWNVSSLLLKFDGLRQLTVDGDVTKPLNGGDNNTLESITITGNVSANIGENTGGFGKAVRQITFANEDPEVIPAAIKTGAFEKASDDAATKDETLSVIYRVQTAKNSNPIFEQKAFNDVDDGIKNVVLYTDQWSLEHTFQNVEIGGAAEQVYRIKLSASSVAPGEDIKATCITGANGKYAYGRLYIPAGTGMRYKVDAKYDETTKKNGVNLFSATISGNGTGSDIYMHQLTVMDGFYWIDANDAAQTLIVRTSEVGAAAGDAVVVEAEFVSEEEAAALDAEGTVILDTDWFDAASAKKNALKYATSAITPAEFQNDATTYNKGIYVMANPKTYNLAFAKYDQTSTDTKDLNKGSIYVVSRANEHARLNVIWPEGIDEESDDTANEAATGINAIETESNDAMYNLQGVRVNNAQKGIFIINGKKVVK